MICVDELTPVSNDSYIPPDVDDDGISAKDLYSNAAPGIVTSVPDDVDELTFSALLNTFGEPLMLPLIFEWSFPYYVIVGIPF